MEKAFGKWVVNDEFILWENPPLPEYFIPIKVLLELRRSKVEVYEWIVQVSPKTWLTKQDVIDLNEAFKYAAKVNNMIIDTTIWDNTMIYQSNMVAEKPI